MGETYQNLHFWTVFKGLPPVEMLSLTRCEAWNEVGEVAAEAEPSHQYPIPCYSVTDGSQGAVWQNGVWCRSVDGAKLCHCIPSWRKNDIHQCLLSIYGDQAVNVSTVRGRVVCFSSADSSVKYKPRSRQPCTAVTPQNEESPDQFIHTMNYIQSYYRKNVLFFFSIAENLLSQIVLLCSLYLLLFPQK